MEKNKENGKCQKFVIGSYVQSELDDEYQRPKQPTGNFPPLTTGQLPTHKKSEEVLWRILWFDFRNVQKAENLGVQWTHLNSA